MPELGEIVRRYCVRMAVRRGVMNEARRRIQMRAQQEEAVAMCQGHCGFMVRPMVISRSIHYPKIPKDS